MFAKGLSRLPASTVVHTSCTRQDYYVHLRFLTAHCAEGIYFRLGLPFFLHSHSGSPRLRAKGRGGERQRRKRGFVITKPASAAAIKGTSSSLSSSSDPSFSKNGDCLFLSFFRESGRRGVDWRGRGEGTNLRGTQKRGRGQRERQEGEAWVGRPCERTRRRRNGI